MLIMRDYIRIICIYIQTKSIETAIPFANKAAAVAVSHTGTYVLTKEDVNEVLR